MKKKLLIIAAAMFFVGLVLCILYYFFYIKKVIIYDLVSIEFSGISSKEIDAIKTYGVTPVDKKISLYRDIDAQDISVGYKTIEIQVPDTLFSKITSISIILKSKTYTLQICDMHSTLSLKNAHSYVLPPEVKSEGAFIDKLNSSYPINIVVPVLKVILPILLYFAGILFIVFCILFIWKCITENLQKRLLKNFITVLQEKKIHYIIFLIIFIILFIWPIFWSNQIKIIYFLIILLYISTIVQNIFRIKKSYSLYLFRVLLIIFLCFEIICGILNKRTIINKLTETSNYCVGDSLVYYRMKPNSFNERSTMMLGSDTVYDVYYSSDSFGRRISVENILNIMPMGNLLKKKHAIFLGCSYTFGDGINVSSTFPFLFEYFHKDYRSYNYGVSGYGPHQSCLLFNEGINTINNDAVPEDSGFCLYTYIDNHLNRVYGGSVYLQGAGGTPDVYADNNELVCKKRSAIKKYISWFLNNSETMKYFNITITYPKTEKFYKRFANIINYTARKYWDLKPHGEFYVGLYPDYAHDTSWLKTLNRDIKVLNIHEPIDFRTNYSSYKIKGDINQHPAKKLNLYYVEEISKMIFKNK